MSPGVMHGWALGLTILLEGAGLALFLIWQRRSLAPAVYGFLLSVGLNLITHTIFWYSFPWFSLLDYGPRLWLAEGLIALTEASVYRRFCSLSWPQALALGVGLNLFSALAGLFVWQILLG